MGAYLIRKYDMLLRLFPWEGPGISVVPLAGRHTALYGGQSQTNEFEAYYFLEAII